MEDPLRIGRHAAIPLAEIELRTSRSSGPGGQHANVTASRVEAVFDVCASRSLSRRAATPDHGAPGPGRASGGAGHAQPVAEPGAGTRRRLRGRLEGALAVQRQRRATKPTAASRRRRAESKRRRWRGEEAAPPAQSYEGWQVPVRVAVVGHVEWCEFAEVPHVPKPGEIVHATRTFDEPAGGGAVAAVQLRKLAGEATLFTAFGDDETGRRSHAAARGARRGRGGPLPPRAPAARVRPSRRGGRAHDHRARAAARAEWGGRARLGPAGRDGRRVPDRGRRRGGAPRAPRAHAGGDPARAGDACRRPRGARRARHERSRSRRGATARATSTRRRA